MKNLILKSFVVAIVGLVACSKSDDKKPAVDNTKPTANLVSFSEVVDQTLSSPVLNAVINFSDDQGLKEYKVDIHDSFDGHSHGRVDGTTTFSFTKNYSISGKTHTATLAIPVPKNAPTGPYHFVVKYLDAAGNEGQELDLDFEIQNNETQPEIVLTNLSYQKSSKSVSFAFSITDPDGEIEDFIIKVLNESTGKVIFEMEEHVHNKRFEISDEFALPQNATLGKHAFVIVAIDDEGNHTFLESEFEIL
jgi:hypothetical protein